MSMQTKVEELRQKIGEEILKVKQADMFLLHKAKWREIGATLQESLDTYAEVVGTNSENHDTLVELLRSWKGHHNKIKTKGDEDDLTWFSEVAKDFSWNVDDKMSRLYFDDDIEFFGERVKELSDQLKKVAIYSSNLIEWNKLVSISKIDDSIITVTKLGDEEYIEVDIDLEKFFNLIDEPFLTYDHYENDLPFSEFTDNHQWKEATHYFIVNKGGTRTRLWTITDNEGNVVWC